MIKKVLMGLAVIAIAAACNKKDIKTTQEERNEIENNRGRVDILDFSDRDYFLKLYGDRCALKTDEFAELFKTYTREQTQIHEINVAEISTVIGEKGTKVIIGANNFIDWRGAPVVGEVDIEIIEVFTRGDMVMLDRATNGISEDGESIVTLESGGEIFIRATQGGREVDIIDPITVIVPDADADPEMLKFVSAGDLGDDFVWEVAEDEEMVVEEDKKGKDGEGDGRGDGKGDGGGGIGGTYVYSYQILPKEWGWTNIDKWRSDPCAKTTLFVEVPSGYDNTNTEVYLSYDGDSGRLANFDLWTGTQFTEHYGQVCIGLECHFIAVTNSSGSLEYAIQGATIVNGHVEVISSFTPISEADLIAEINGLP